MVTITTELDIGDIVWVPRVYPDRINKSIVVDGKTYYSADEVEIHYRPEAREKIITEILIDVADTISIEYHGKDPNNCDYDTSIVHRSVDPKRYFKTKEEALKFAEKLAKKREDYY